MMILDHLTASAKAAIEAVSITTLFATMAGWLPSIAACLSIVWWSIRLYETDTVQRWLKKWREQCPPSE